MIDTSTGADVGMRTARERLHHRDERGKHSPLCLACGNKATNQLPSCNEPKCVKAVRPVYRWAKHVADQTTTRGYNKAA